MAKNKNIADTIETEVSSAQKTADQLNIEPIDSKRKKLEEKEKMKELKAWEKSIVANKRVKRELNRRRFSKIMLAVMLVALVLTATAYITVLLVEQNSIRIHASYSGDKTLAMTENGRDWSSILDVVGPEYLWNISYDKHVAAAHNVKTLPDDEEIAKKLGNFSEEDAYIGFAFKLKNTSSYDLAYSSKIRIQSQSNGLDEAIRVMWLTIDDETGEILERKIYAKRSSNPILRELTGGIEYICYPDGYFSGSYRYNDGETAPEGLYLTTPFLNDEYILYDSSTVVKSGDTVKYAFVIWIEGSDPECEDSILTSFVKMAIHFTVTESVEYSTYPSWEGYEAKLPTSPETIVQLLHSKGYKSSVMVDIYNNYQLVTIASITELTSGNIIFYANYLETEAVAKGFYQSLMSRLPQAIESGALPPDTVAGRCGNIVWYCSGAYKELLNSGGAG